MWTLGLWRRNSFSGNICFEECVFAGWNPTLYHRVFFYFQPTDKKYPLLYMFIHVIFPVYNKSIDVVSLNYNVFVYFCGWRECWPLL